MKRLTALALALIALLAVACGGNDDGEPTPTYTVPGGVNTSLPRHLTSVFPQQASFVTDADLHTGEDGSSGGVCAGFDFLVGEGMGDDPTSRVTLLVEQEDVTGSAIWQISASQPPTGGTLCYAPPEALPPGERTATVRYSDSTDRQFVYNWTFTLSASP